MEYLDIYDENGNYLGEEERKIVHQKALWHNTIHCWLYDAEGNVYFQKRKDKQKLYTTASGHVKAKETLKEAFGREIKEEIGTPIAFENAQKIEVVKFVMDREEPDGSIFRDRAFANIFMCEFLGELKELNYQEEELAGIVKINAQETLELIKKEEGTIEGVFAYKKEGKIKEERTIFSLDDFLVNPGENAYQKYGKVLENIIKETV